MSSIEPMSIRQMSSLPLGARFQVAVKAPVVGLGVAIAIAAGAVSGPAPLSAQAPMAESPTDVARLSAANAVRVDVGPVVDGTLDDPAWLAAPVMTDFIQREPSDGQPASERTEVRVVFDTDAVYVGVWAYDSRPADIVYGEAIRDYEVAESDYVLFVLDTYNDEQNGFVFGTTPAGIEYDGQIANEGSGGGFFLGGGGGNNRQRFQAGAGGGFNKNWDGSWDRGHQRSTANGWYAEFMHPVQRPFAIRPEAQQRVGRSNFARRESGVTERRSRSGPPIPRAVQPVPGFELRR